MWGDYDAWKTACCGNYPNCHPCPYDTDYEEDEECEEKECEN